MPIGFAHPAVADCAAGGSHISGRGRCAGRPFPFVAEQIPFTTGPERNILGPVCATELSEPSSDALPGSGPAVGGRTIAEVIVSAILVFGLAYYSPVESVDADPAVALIASQALIEHHTLRLDPYRGRSELVYDLASDYRVRHFGGASYPNSLGVPILSVPAVWLANRMGLDMLDQRAEFATQNLLSALSCTLLFVLLFRMCCMYLGGGASLTIAVVSMLGTSLMSTGATGLWNSDYSLIFVSLALLHLIGRQHGGVSRSSLLYLGALVAVGFLCRPSTGIFGLAVLVYLLGEQDRRIVLSAAVALLAVGLAVAIPSLVPLPLIAGHYSPARLRFVNPLGMGLYGVLLSPSRGLFVFSPFLGVVAAGNVRYFRLLRRDRIFWLCTVWIVAHTLAVAMNQGKWWGGHSFGPRMLVDLMPAFVVLTCLVWQQVERSEPLKIRRLAMAAYLPLAMIAVATHTGQGLFNPATRLWNLSPDIDRDPELALDWRYPQFMASERLLEARWDDYERREVEDRRGRLNPYALGTPIPFDSAEVIFVHWYGPEDGWRWTRGDGASVLLRLPRIDPRRLHLLEILAGSMGTQRVGVHVNGVPVSEFNLTGFDPAWRLVAVPGSLLRSRAENTLELRVSDPSSTANDSRRLGVSLRQLRLAPLPTDFLEVTYADDPFFGDGFSEAEGGWRWTDGTQARLHYPVGSVIAESEYVLTIRARALGEQRIDLNLNGVSIGSTVVAGVELTSITQRFPGTLLLADQINRVELTLPDATTPPGETRRMALALVSFSIAPVAEDAFLR